MILASQRVTSDDFDTSLENMLTEGHIPLVVVLVKESTGQISFLGRSSEILNAVSNLLNNYYKDQLKRSIQ